MENATRSVCLRCNFVSPNAIAESNVSGNHRFCFCSRSIYDRDVAKSSQVKRLYGTLKPNISVFTWMVRRLVFSLCIRGKNRGNGLMGLRSISIIGVVKNWFFVYDLHVIILTFFEMRFLNVTQGKPAHIDYLLFEHISYVGMSLSN